MAYDTIKLPPHLMAWRLAGVDCLLADTDLPPELSLCPTPTGGLIPPPREWGTGGLTPPPLSASTHAPARPARVTQMRTAQEQSTPKQTAQPPKMPPEMPPEIVLLPVDNWPALWQERLRLTRPASVLWTYWAFGEDVCGTPNPARRDFLQRILKDMRELGHPAGTHSFWPAALPDVPNVPDTPSLPSLSDKGNLIAHPRVFWSGVEILKARALVVMGSSAAKAIALPTGLRPLQHIRYRGKLIVILRDIDFLANEAHEYDPVRAFLKETLMPFAARTHSADVF